MDIKTIFRLMALIVLTLCIQGCSDDEDKYVEPPLAVTPANIAGAWQLTQWNSAPLAEGTYCYIIFNRRERTYAMYQKFDSMYARCITGTYSIEENSDSEYIISGTYDYGRGNWNNSYIVTELYAQGSMVWTAKEDKTDVSVYKRCDSVPQDIIDEARIVSDK